MNKFKQTEIGLIPEDWGISEVFKIAEVTDFVANGSFASLKQNVRYYNHKNYAKLIRLTDYNTDFNSNQVYLDEDGYNFLKKTKLHGGEIIISNVGAYAGTVFRVPKLNINMSLGPNAILVKTKLSDDFYYYWFISDGKKGIYSILTGSASPKFNKGDFRNLKVPVPPLSEQKAIAKVLSDLDSKIELNQQMNKTLEEIGKTLFKRWFVDFEFPNEEGNPYKSSGGEMVYNEELKKEIPKGSQIISLKDQLIFERGIEPGSSIYEDSKTENNIRFIRVSDLNNDNATTFIPLELATSKIIESDVLLSLDASVGIVKIGYNGSFSSGMRKVYDNSNKFPNSLIYFLLKSEDIQNTINQYANGTTILHAGKSIEFMNFIIPNDTVLTKFEKQVTPIFNQILDNIQENKQLAETRDLLLPKLMSGKIRVKY